MARNDRALHPQPLPHSADFHPESGVPDVRENRGARTGNYGHTGIFLPQPGLDNRPGGADGGFNRHLDGFRPDVCG